MKTLLSVVRALVTEIADEIRASRNENIKHPGGKVMTRNTKLTDSVSMMRAANARLAAVIGDTSRATATLSDARQLAAEVALSGRAS